LAICSRAAGAGSSYTRLTIDAAGLVEADARSGEAHPGLADGVGSKPTPTGDDSMAQPNATVRLGALALVAGIALGACGGRLQAGARADAADPTPAPPAAETSPGPTTAASGAPPLAPSDEAPPTPSPAAATKPSPRPTPKPTAAPTPVPAPDLTQLEQLIDQLDDALAADGAATEDEGSPQ
jgi:outer membrane biosynthesis protein TonB